MGYLVDSYEKTITAQGIILRKSGEGIEVFLVHDRGKENKKPAGWGLPGGKVEKNETADDGLVREVEEETPFRVSGCHYLFTEEKKCAGARGANQIQVFLAEVCEESRTKAPSAEEEIDGGRWFTPEEIFRAPFAGPDMENGVYFSHKARIFLALRLLGLIRPLAEEDAPPPAGERKRMVPY